MLTHAALTLFHARRAAGLTQAEVAERLGTSQPAIARLERDFSGSMSLRRFVDYCLACGVAPLNIMVDVVADVRRYVLRDINAPVTPTAYYLAKLRDAFNTTAQAGSELASEPALTASNLPLQDAVTYRITNPNRMLVSAPPFSGSTQSGLPALGTEQGHVA